MNTLKRIAPTPDQCLTDKQAAVLFFCWDFYRQNDQLPTREAVAGYFEFASLNAAQSHMAALARKGWLDRNALGKWKFSVTARAALEHAEYTDACQANGTLLPRGTPVADNCTGGY